ncbi:MAG: PhzF family phenazine biosynthesis protein, partial [Candidatus Eremiobacteraeota bacterium]|nr:PhzF family phenazine biosynthesis protein [Candidatus Eremiobacteraeota bacterium]
APEAVAKIRIFTPRRELDFAGHPTIGSAYVFARDRASAGRFALEENIGLVPIDMDVDHAGATRFWLTTPPITFLGSRQPSICARLLRLSEEDLISSAPPQIVSAGSPLLFIGLRSPEAVDRAELQMPYLAEALGDVDVVGTFIFARKNPASQTALDVYSRMFAPQTGIPEDPATGGATGPLAAYMLKCNLLPMGRDLEFTSEQGTKMRRRSILALRISASAGEPIIKVGGSAVLTGEGTLFLDDT